ncbi:lipopolysaccharide assembly protein LapB [Geobacillus sp. C56-T2]|uniref:tetratricopeptide repeat protein n=1 Tax=Geobacillus sp. C56-T2 TaxID=600773 RepID=UPI0011A2E849|nr:tetratricopeptide repeat protein [Geobacillus sp. C56-T2]NNV06907.1 tetratricopeptide repeat protein [Geobacillus sp. MMMUD3]TWG31823.1 tetratricopeptide repeat protein [Geobacillus sp. C56-T2]
MGKRLKQPSRKSTIVPFIQSGEYFFKKGMKAYDRGDLYKAKKYLERAVRLDGRDASFVLQLALVLSELGEYQSSNQWLFAIIHDLDETMYDCFYFLANNFACLGLFQEARQYAEHYLTHEPDGEFADDAADLLELVKFDVQEMTEEQEQVMAWQERARYLLEQGEFAEAIETLKAVIACRPEFWPAHNNLALAYFYSGDVERAQRQLEEVLAHDPGNLHALCNALVFAHYLRDEQQTTALGDTLAGLYPLFREHQYKLGATMALVGRFDVAFRWLHRLYKYGFEADGPFYYWLAYAAYHTGHEPLARQVWERFAALHPEKRGEGPWMERTFGDETLVRIVRWLETEELADQLYGLYLFSRSPQAGKAELALAISRLLPSDPRLRPFADYFLFGRADGPAMRAVNIGRMIDALSAHNEEKEAIGRFAFAMAIRLSAQDEPFANGAAWAAALEYLWRRQRGERVTQKGMAAKYRLSVATVQKYVRKARRFDP